MSEPYLGEIRLFSFNFAPRGWAFCQGQTLPINQNQALFALLGTTYGGNGQTTFSLPNLAGRAAISSGQGLGLSPHNLGESAGSPSVTLTINQIPAHNHNAVGTKNKGSLTGNPLGTPVNQVWAADAGDVTKEYAPATGTLHQMHPAAIGQTGSSQGHENRQSFLALSYCIALQGVFPSRN
jgi:microcystin-dependent protein